MMLRFVMPREERLAVVNDEMTRMMRRVGRWLSVAEVIVGMKMMMFEMENVVQTDDVFAYNKFDTLLSLLQFVLK